MAQPRNTLRLVHARASFNDVMVSANVALSKGKSEEAIRHYTEVLYKLAPAHVCALLNRSLAYLQNGQYELAAMDAYRACITASELREHTEVADRRLSRIAKYIRAEQLHVDADDSWTKPGHRNIGAGWAASPLACIVVNATPEVTIPNGVKVPPFGTSRASLARALEIRATYRLCGTLFVIGDGARKDALDLIDDARFRMQMTFWESRWFDKLGNDIMIQLASEVDPFDPRDLRLLGHDTKEERDERMTKLKEDMMATTTRLGYGNYPWDPYEPKLGEIDWKRQAQEWVETCSSNCSALTVEPEETDGTQAEGPSSYVELRANRHIESGELVLSEQSISNVTTSIPEQVAARRRVGIFDHYYCNSCASTLTVHQQCPNKFQSLGRPAELEVPSALPSSSSPIPSTQNSTDTSQGEPSTGANNITHSQQSSSSRSPSLSLAPLPSRQEFMFCHPNHLVPTCSAACRELSEDFDNGICHTKIEQSLRHSHFNDLKPRSITDRKTQCLRDLIFLRHITIAINLGQSPLETNDLMFATSGPTMRGTPNSKVEPWSFISHVVRPLRYIQQLFKNTDTDQFLKFSQLDGWIIHTLLFKINKAMRISKGPRYVKSFRAGGTLDTAFGPGNDRWDQFLTQLPKEPKDQSIWIASIDSLFNMIRIADPEKGERPNVVVVQKEGVNVYAIKSDDGPAIKAGEPLLRAADGNGGSESDEVLYTPVPSDVMEGVYDGEEADEGEETHSGDTSDFMEEFSVDEEEDMEEFGVDDEGDMEDFSADGEEDEDDMGEGSDDDELGGEDMEVD